MLFDGNKLTLRKEKVRKRKRKKPKIGMFSKNRLMAKNQRDKMDGSWMLNPTPTKKKNRKKRNTLRQAFCGNKIDKKPLILKENSLFGPLWQNTWTKTQATKNKTIKKRKKKTYQKKTLLHFGKQPLFLVNFCSCSSYILSCLQELGRCWKKDRRIVSSADAQLLGITESTYLPFRSENPKWHFCDRRSAHFGYSPVSAETPITVVFALFDRLWNPAPETE